MKLRPCVGCAACCHLQVELVAGIDDVPEELTYCKDDRWYMQVMLVQHWMRKMGVVQFTNADHWNATNSQEVVEHVT